MKRKQNAKIYVSTREAEGKMAESKKEKYQRKADECLKEYELSGDEFYLEQAEAYCRAAEGEQ